QDSETGEPESMVLSDKHLIITFVGYALAVVFALSDINLPFLYR
ncbi:MAG: hypothetical protein RLZ87_726, partial [Armatimonadota bacterium]